MSDTNKYYKEKEHKAGWVVTIHLWEVNSGAPTWRLKEVKAKPWKYPARKSGPGRRRSKCGGFQEEPGQASVARTEWARRSAAGEETGPSRAPLRLRILLWGSRDATEAFWERSDLCIFKKRKEKKTPLTTLWKTDCMDIKNRETWKKAIPKDQVRKDGSQCQVMVEVARSG